MPSAQTKFVQRTLKRAVLLPVIAAAIVGLVFLAIIERLLVETNRLNLSEQVIVCAEQIRRRAIDMETGQRGYLLSNDRRFLEPYQRASAAMPQLVVRLDQLVSDNPPQHRRAEIIAADIAEWRRHAEHIVPGRAIESQLVKGKVLMDRIRADIDTFLQAEQVLSDQRTESVRLTTIAGVSTTVILAAIAAVVLVIFIRADLRALSDRYEGALATSERAAMTKDRLLAMVSHELRTPLTSILGWATLLRDQTADPETTRLALSSIVQSAHLQSRLIEDLIDVSRAATGKLRVELEEIDLRDVLRAALKTMKPAADAKHVTVSTSIPETDSTIMGDAERLQQVFWNLLSNAVRFTPAGGTIQLAASSDNGSEVVRVRDTGAGIDPEFLPHVFEPFSQEHEAARQSMGLGLGLAIARRLVEMHGGTIEAKSDGPGRGAEFIVRLPHLTARTSVIQ